MQHCLNAVNRMLMHSHHWYYDDVRGSKGRDVMTAVSLRVVVT